MRTASSIGSRKIFPSPLRPVRLTPTMVSTTRSTGTSETTMSSRLFGTQKTGLVSVEAPAMLEGVGNFQIFETDSMLPRISGSTTSMMFPPCLPRPCTVCTVTESTPTPESASSVSLTLSCRMIAKSSLTALLPCGP